MSPAMLIYFTACGALGMALSMFGHSVFAKEFWIIVAIVVVMVESSKYV